MWCIHPKTLGSLRLPFRALAPTSLDTFKAEFCQPHILCASPPFDGEGLQRYSPRIRDQSVRQGQSLNRCRPKCKSAVYLLMVLPSFQVRRASDEKLFAHFVTKQPHRREAAFRDRISLTHPPCYQHYCKHPSVFTTGRQVARCSATSRPVPPGHVLYCIVA